MGGPAGATAPCRGRGSTPGRGEAGPGARERALERVGPHAPGQARHGRGHAEVDAREREGAAPGRGRNAGVAGHAPDRAPSRGAGTRPRQEREGAAPGQGRRRGRGRGGRGLTAGEDEAAGGGSTPGGDGRGGRGKRRRERAWGGGRGERGDFGEGTDWQVGPNRAWRRWFHSPALGTAHGA
eukprot:XP_020400939.1 glycine-rich cell wall structural protein 1.0-like [Zea mays]